MYTYVYIIYYIYTSFMYNIYMYIYYLYIYNLYTRDLKRSPIAFTMNPTCRERLQQVHQVRSLHRSVRHPVAMAKKKCVSMVRVVIPTDSHISMYINI